MNANAHAIKSRLLLSLALPLLGLCGCAPTVNVAVPKPVVIDVNMKVDVTSRNETPAAGTKGNNAVSGAASSASGPSKDDTLDGAAEDANLISEEVQSMKDSRLIGEASTGYLAVRTIPAGKIKTGESYADYVKRIVDQENRARRTLYGRDAAKDGTPLDTVARSAGKRMAQTANPGEWLQDDSGQWKQK